MQIPHVANAEIEFNVVNITPDFCRVGGKTVPFDIFRDLSHEKQGYSKDVYARGTKVITVGSIIDGVVGNAGEGIVSGVSQRDGNVLVVEGSQKVLVNGKKVARHGDLCLMNTK